MTKLRRPIHYLLNRRRMDKELAEEMESHREMASKSGGLPRTYIDDLRSRPLATPAVESVGVASTPPAGRFAHHGFR